MRQRASELLRQVQRGETIQITDRGRPVALLGPLPEGSPLERLREAGQVRSAEDELDDLPQPLEVQRGQETPSVILARLRRDER